MKNKTKILILISICVAAIAGLAIYISGHNLAILNPKGQIADKERRLIIESTLLMLIVVVPVYFLTFGIAWKYRAGNKKAKYDPELDHNRLVETVWWAVPGLIILVLAVITWNSSHDLDPSKHIISNKTPLKIQVIAMQWKWLFIYPDQDVASVNYFKIPLNRPVDFDITSDAPMNSFWIPQLGGQIYAMSGMNTHLHLMANNAGLYRGSSANISGEGFSKMTFSVKAASDSEFNNWVSYATRSQALLDQKAYNQLSKPGAIDKPIYYSHVTPGLYMGQIMKYMTPQFDPGNLPSAEVPQHVH